MNVNFIDQSTGSPTSWRWDFGDGITSTEKNAVHQYTVPGTFTVILKVSNANGQDSTTKKDFIVITPAPVAAFKADRQSGKAPFVVRFTDLSKGIPTSWSWDFGDGTGSDEQNPNHIYMNEGSYDVRLTVSNQYGSDTVFMTGNSSASSTVTAAPVGTPAVVVTGTPEQIVTKETATQATTATRSPLSPVVAVLASMAGLLLIALAKRK